MIPSAPAVPLEARTPPPVRRISTRATCQNLPYIYPRIPRPVIRQGNTPKATLDSQFQVNASHIQKPFSLVSVSFPSRTANPLIDNVSERKPGIRRTAQYSARGRKVGALTFPAVQHFPHTRRFEGVLVDDHHPRTAKTRIPSISITYSPRLPPIETTIPGEPFRRRFIAVRPSCLSTLRPRQHRIDSVFYASTHRRERSSSKKFAMRKDDAGVCGFPRADSQKIWSTCSRS